MSKANSVTKDLGRKRMLHDENFVLRCYDLLMEWGYRLKKLLALYIWVLDYNAVMMLRKTWLMRKKKGKQHFAASWRNELNTTTKICLHQFKKMKRKAFAAMKIKKSNVNKDKSLSLKADLDLFARLLVICGKHDIAMREVLTYSLGVLPWSLTYCW